VLIQLLKHPGDFMRRELGYKKEKFWRHLGRVLSWRLHKVLNSLAGLCSNPVHP
jgi:hypothetical protein